MQPWAGATGLPQELNWTIEETWLWPDVSLLLQRKKKFLPGTWKAHTACLLASCARWSTLRVIVSINGRKDTGQTLLRGFSGIAMKWQMKFCSVCVDRGEEGNKIHSSYLSADCYCPEESLTLYEWQANENIISAAEKNPNVSIVHYWERHFPMVQGCAVPTSWQT